MFLGGQGFINDQGMNLVVGVYTYVHKIVLCCIFNVFLYNVFFSTCSNKWELFIYCVYISIFNASIMVPIFYFLHTFILFSGRVLV